MGRWFDRVFREDLTRRGHWSCDRQEEEPAGISAGYLEAEQVQEEESAGAKAQRQELAGMFKEESEQQRRRSLS